MNNRIDEIRARLDSFRYAVGETHTMPDNYIGPCEDEFYDEAPADIAWLLEQYEWMSKERDKVIDWLSDGYGNRVEVEEVLFQFGVINGHLEDGTPWTGTCSCNAKLREECYCGYEWKFADE